MPHQPPMSPSKPQPYFDPSHKTFLVSRLKPYKQLLGQAEQPQPRKRKQQGRIELWPNLGDGRGQAAAA